MKKLPGYKKNPTRVAWIVTVRVDTYYQIHIILFLWKNFAIRAYIFYNSFKFLN